MRSGLTAKERRQYGKLMGPSDRARSPEAQARRDNEERKLQEHKKQQKEKDSKS